MKQKITHIAILILIFVIGYMSFTKWHNCWRFVDQFYTTSSMRQNELLLLTNGEQGVPLFIVRMFFNKVAYLPWSIFQTLLQYFDVRFLQRFIGVVGGIGVFMGLWYFFTKYRNNFLMWIPFSTLLVFAIYEMLFAPHYSFGNQILFFFILFQIFSLFGTWQFLHGKHMVWRYIVIGLLVLLSIIYLSAFPNAYQNYCLSV